MKYNEFVRIFLHQNGLRCFHIKEDVIANEYQCEFSNTAKLDIIHKIKVPIELIVHHRSMTCNSLVTKELSKKEILNLVHNTIEKNNINNSQLNTIFYNIERNKTKHIIVHMYECDLDKELFNILNLLKDNPRVSTTVFPMWVTSNFIKMYYNDTYNFSTNVFVTEYLGCWNIIVVNDEHVIYNRSGISTSFQKDIEIQNTLNHIQNIYNIDIEDIIIYEFGENTINSLNIPCNNNMKIVSNFDREQNKCSTKTQNNVIRIACFSVLGINLSFLFHNIYTIHKLITLKTSYVNYINNCNKHIVNDLSMWDNLHNIYYSLKDISYLNMINDYMKENHIDTLNNLHLQLDDNNNLSCSVNA
ncbi:MAG: hypothetical protein IJ848_02910 [Alphaproteobacteria bacterium]|nr:hypothetical protein [Alphaproteobacteria bacterium]